MPNHFHSVCSHSDGDIPSVMRDLKRHTSKLIAGYPELHNRNAWISFFQSQTREGLTIWMEGYHPEQIRTEGFFSQKMDYVHNNPVRAGFVRNPSEWKYSSAAFYYADAEPEVPVTPIQW
jgi:REP element-mobilizing transposase RayT